ncbi:helix-turn-helix transcriptional regulator [Variovorax sp. KBW07]|uniref:helix-turn-helix transcriptional regulator n=1 Tax=Variovorax sp. KBW07 TaxID=2153358 RepID=UPI000F574E47|nr:helix-turn-helix transcriptional regulator [Variovorax sp. KBW07]RQO50659.1 helix-turn-helix transcriptional regulator [Variovorax sp. KBW07]
MKKPAALQDFSTLLLRLYRLSHELPIVAFQDAALDLIKPVLPFDSSMWGTATRTDNGIDIHTIHLHNQPVEMLTAYEEVKHLDTAAVEVGKRPKSTLTFNADSWFHRDDQAQLRDYGQRFEQSNFFISSDVHPQTNFVHWLSLFRADPDAHGTEDERQLLASLVPHVMQALALNRIVHLDRLEAGSQAPCGSAIGDLRGVLYHADGLFEATLKAEWPSWHGRTLPDALLKHFLEGHTKYSGHGIVVTHHVEQRLLFLKSRRRYRADSLTPRERTIAELLARGDTHKEVATILHRSPATVRNHIQSIYDKLEVSNVAGLIHELRLAG